MKINKERICCFFKRKRIAIGISLLNTLILLPLLYWHNNQTIFTGDSSLQHSITEVVKGWLNMERSEANGNVVFVNVANDKQLVDIFAKMENVQNKSIEIPIGNIDITDRSKLLQFLQILHTTNAYSYIFLDVRFEKGYEVAEVDSLLYAEIKRMRDIVVVNHEDIIAADGLPMEKAAINDYKTTILSSDFRRYKYLYDDNKPSAALYAYHELTGKDIKEHWWGYSSDGNLCVNNLFIDFSINENAVSRYLGSDILLLNTGEITKLTANKYVVIGNMDEDLHTTYVGKKTGPEVTYYSFLSLLNDKHLISFSLIMNIAAVLFLISLLQFSHKPLIERLPYVRRLPKLLLFFLSLIEYAILLPLALIIINVKLGIFISIFIPTIYFALQKQIIKYIRM